MRISERLLAALSRSPGSPDFTLDQETNVDNALHGLIEVFPHLTSIIGGKRVLDFGCGLGHQAIALALAGSRFVLGVEINQRWLAEARRLAESYGVQDRISFLDAIPAEQHGSFDVGISHNSMEHFSDPEAILEIMRTAISPGGSLLISFAPPWFAPYGSHMHFFTRVPWVHLIFPERSVMSVRSRYRSDGAMRYEDVEGGLNKMSLHKFERMVKSSGLRVRMSRLDTVKGIPIVHQLPVLRELLVNRVACILERSDSGG